LVIAARHFDSSPNLRQVASNDVVGVILRNQVGQAVGAGKGFTNAGSVFFWCRVERSRSYDCVDDTVDDLKRILVKLDRIDLVRRITSRNRHTESDWGNPLGHEVW
jgi:hypothetical protein